LIRSRDAVDLVAEELDLGRRTSRSRGRPRRRRPARGTAALEVDVVALVLHVDQARSSSSRSMLLPTLTVITICA
jgi:hypothetical protein